MSYEIGNPQWIWLLIVSPLTLALTFYSSWSRRRALQRFGTIASSRGYIANAISSLLLAAGFALLAIACMDIRWGKTTREVPQKGLEVVFALDVSRSMLAEDAKPNRLARAKQQIKDMVAEMAGDRVGLVAFAGEAVLKVPLTSHYDDFREVLDSLGPHSIPVGGSQLGPAIEEAGNAFLSKTQGHRTIMLFTDGEDQESKPVELAKKLHAEEGMRVFTVGLGDMDQGARIPGRQSRQSFVKHNGQQVWSKLNGTILRQIATQTDAAYIPAGTKRVNMADVYHRFIANIEKSEFETAKINAFIPRFQWFAFPAFLCLFGYALLSKIKKTRSTKSESNSQKNSLEIRSKTGFAGAAMIVAMFLPLAANAQESELSIAEQINDANELVRNNQCTEAISEFGKIGDTADPELKDKLNYNLGIAHYRNSDFAAAQTLFTESAKSSDDRIAADSRYNLGNCLYASALSATEQQPDVAIEKLQQSITSYRSALRIDRSLADARKNIELARKLIQSLKNQQQQEQPQQQQKQDQKQDKNPQEQESQDKSNESESKDQQQESEQKNQKSDEASQDSESSQNGSDKSKQDSSGESEDKSDASQRPQDSQSNPDEQPAESQKPSTSNNQSDSAGADDADQHEDAATDKKSDTGEEPPKGNITPANEQGKDEPGEPNVALQPDDTQKNDMMTRQEALKLLQAVRDRDMLRRLRKQQRQRQRRVQVDKDW